MPGWMKERISNNIMQFRQYVPTQEKQEQTKNKLW